jgi:hypothetical protein
MNSFSRAVMVSYRGMVETVVNESDEPVSTLEACLRQAVLSEDCNYEVSDHLLNLALDQVDYGAIVDEMVRQ